jgi:transposase-like protein
MISCQAQGDTAAAKRFLRRDIDAAGNAIPRVMNLNENPAYPAAVEALKADGAVPHGVELRQCKYLSHVIEQDHLSVKKCVWFAKGYGSLPSASALHRRPFYPPCHLTETN